MLKNNNMLKININNYNGMLIANKDNIDFNKTKNAYFFEPESRLENN